MGGFGTVWKAHHTELDRVVAVKIPRKGTSLMPPRRNSSCVRRGRPLNSSIRAWSAFTKSVERKIPSTSLANTSMALRYRTSLIDELR